ncbi:MAG: UDP-2,4-diacetamido-2,4,6-trideoxy-beta-L-altropyranose hydrolase [Candidatus Nitrosotenuis sp.]
MKQKLNILVKTAGGTNTREELGFGHIYRCVNLASFLSDHKIIFLLEDFGGAKKILNEKGHRQIFLLKKNAGIVSDLRSTISLIKKKKIDVLIIDRYQTKKKFASQVRKHVKIALISDLFNVDYDADLVVNGFIGLKNQIRINRYGSKCLFGPKYQILDKRFAEPSTKSSKKTKLLVTLGGFDKKNVVKLVLESLAKTQIKSKIILGPGTPFTSDLKSLVKHSKFLQIQQKTNDMKKEIANSSFGICAGGITSYEFASLGVPFAIICQARHQLQVAREWQQRGIALNLGLPKKDIEKKINILLDQVSKSKQTKIGKKLVDGFGAKRVAKEIIKLAN